MACWLVVWRVDSLPKIPQTEVDFFSHSLQRNLVDDGLEKTLYESLTKLSISSRRQAVVNRWLRTIWQTSPSEKTNEMETWKVKNPEWVYKVLPWQLPTDPVAL